MLDAEPPRSSIAGQELARRLESVPGEFTHRLSSATPSPRVSGRTHRREERLRGRSRAPGSDRWRPEAIPQCSGLEPLAADFRGLAVWQSSSEIARDSEAKASRVRLVPGTGVEPARPCGHQILSLARLPIPPPGQPTPRLRPARCSVNERRTSLGREMRATTASEGRELEAIEPDDDRAIATLGPRPKHS